MTDLAYATNLGLLLQFHCPFPYSKMNEVSCFMTMSNPKDQVWIYLATIIKWRVSVCLGPGAGPTVEVGKYNQLKEYPRQLVNSIVWSMPHSFPKELKNSLYF